MQAWNEGGVVDLREPPPVGIPAAERKNEAVVEQRSVEMPSGLPSGLLTLKNASKLAGGVPMRLIVAGKRGDIRLVRMRMGDQMRVFVERAELQRYMTLHPYMAQRSHKRAGRKAKERKGEEGMERSIDSRTGRTGWTMKDIEKVARGRKEGRTLRDIGGELGKTYGSVWMVLHELKKEGFSDTPEVQPTVRSFVSDLRKKNPALFQ